MYGFECLDYYFKIKSNLMCFKNLFVHSIDIQKENPNTNFAGSFNTQLSKS